MNAGASGSEYEEGLRAGVTDARVRTLEDWMREHKEEHRSWAADMKTLARWQGGLAVLIFILGIVGPLLAAAMVKR